MKSNFLNLSSGNFFGVTKGSDWNVLFKKINYDKLKKLFSVYSYTNMLRVMFLKDTYL